VTFEHLASVGVEAYNLATIAGPEPEGFDGYGAAKANCKTFCVSQLVNFLFSSEREPKER
jgi:hypothetical protein